MKNLTTGKHIWWKRPSIRTEGDMDEERKASWLELFWDLIFVAAIAELSHFMMHGIHGFHDVFTMMLLFVPVWWIWNGVTFYNERYEMNNVRHRVLMFVSMLPVAGIAYTIHDALGTLANLFAIFNIVARLVLTYMWMTAHRTELEKKLCTHFSVGLMVSSALFLASVFVNPAYRIALWSAAIVADLASPLFSLDIQAKLPRISTSHLPERFGLLIILTLGETVISSFKGLSDIKTFNWFTLVLAAESLLITFMIWWLYIDHVMYRVFKPGLWYALSWCYLHLPLFIAIIGLSATVGIITATPYTSAWQHVPLATQWQLAILLSVVLLVLILINIVSESHDHHHKLIDFHDRVERDLIVYKFLGLVFIIAVVALANTVIPPVFLLLAVIAGLCFPVINGLYIWVNASLNKPAH